MRKFISIAIVFGLPFFLGACVEKQEAERMQDQEEVKATVEKLLFAAGNYNIEDLDSMVSDKAMIGISSLKNGVWENTELTIEEYFENVRKRELRPYCEIPQSYEITVTEGRLALVRADAILHRYGIPQTREVNNFLLMKENEEWKFLSLSFTIEQLADEKKEFDWAIFARSYAQAWGSKRPALVASYFEEEGSLQVNEGAPATGRAEITKTAQSFMTDLPDMRVSFDSLVTKPNGTEFHWTLTGTYNVTGKKIKVSGFELWTMGENGLIENSFGSFDAKEYTRQLKFGVAD